MAVTATQTRVSKLIIQHTTALERAKLNSLIVIVSDDMPHIFWPS
jgi:hypothetical protein